MLYVRKDLLGQEEMFDGDAEDIIYFMALLKKFENNEYELAADENGMYLEFTDKD